MVRVIALVEGQSEERFIRELLAPSLGKFGVGIVATTYGRPRTQGGVPAWAKAERELVRLLKQDTGRYVTTMFDYYGLPGDWPGRKAAGRQPSYADRAHTVEQALQDRISASLGGDHTRRLVPYIQMHEFEALLFSDPEILAKVLSRDVDSRWLTQEVARIAGAFGTPEEIDDDPVTAPSKRILQLVPGYEKVADGSIAASRIGVRMMRRKCRHFDAWLRRLVALGGAGGAGEGK